ncbi:hypothetical protein NQ176_g6470 [Zarea fungicola]|uniref:Uncharacterized protein n=1 Tax=Zarea fungicola TaxID=93591 RepID=A0ACC1N4J2_9HYPO|nr:hypothetical protein NQ176_g6470 [Lecanicillium fungicola]
MAPKKKGNKKQDDWEADLGETIAPQDANGQPNADNANANGDDGADAGGGGLMAQLRKNKAKRKNKGGQDNDFVEGEEAPGATTAAPEEATMTTSLLCPLRRARVSRVATRRSL